MDEPIDYAEQCLIGSVIAGGRSVLDDINVKPSDFSTMKHELAWSLLLSMAQQGTQIDLATSGAALRTADETTRRNVDAVWLSKIAMDTPTYTNAAYYAEIVSTEAMRRNITKAATSIAQAAQSMEASDLVDYARTEIDRAADVDINTLQPMSAHIGETLDQMKSAPSFMPTPWESLNDVIGGFRPGAMYVVGARPGAGKTIVGLQAALEMTKHGAVLFSTLEMGQGEMHKRVLSQQALVPMNAIINNQLSREQWSQIESLAEPSWASLYINDSATQTAESIRLNARSIARRRPLACVVVDYLQLMEGTAPKGTSRQALVAQWSRKLKLMAKTLNVPVIALSQLNRESDKGMNGEKAKPKLSDLRESGAIEQDADVVMLMSRDEESGELFMQVAKNRHGARSNLKLGWWGQYSMLTDPWARPTAKAIAA